MSKFYLSQIFATCSLIATTLCTWQKGRKKILLFLIFDSIFLAISYSFLNAYTGAITNIICIFRNICFYLKENNKKMNNKCIPMAFVLMHIIIGIFLFDSFNSILPIIGSITFCLTAWQSNAKTVRIGTIIMVFMWLIYDITVKSYISILSETISLLSAILAVIKIDLLKGYEKCRAISKLLGKTNNKMLDKIEE